MMRPAPGPFRSCLLGLWLAAAPAIAAAPPSYGGLPADYSYAELADMVTVAPLTVAADVVQATALKPADTPGIAPGRTRYFVRATTRGLLAGRTELPVEVRYLVDLPDPPRGKWKLKGVPVLLLAAPAPRSGELILVGPRAEVPRTEANETRVRSILQALVAADAPPAITGIGRAFHVAGSLPGEGETQIFLRTADNRPISLSVLRRPGEQPRWAVALSELVDASAEPPKPDSFLWYRLACGLPPALPDSAVEGQAAEDAQAAREDYTLVLKGLGTCQRGTAATADGQKDASSTPTP